MGVYDLRWVVASNRMTLGLLRDYCRYLLLLAGLLGPFSILDRSRVVIGEESDQARLGIVGVLDGGECLVHLRKHLLGDGLGHDHLAGLWDFGSHLRRRGPRRSSGLGGLDVYRVGEPKILFSTWFLLPSG